MDRTGQSFAFSTDSPRQSFLSFPQVCFNNWEPSLEELVKLKCIRKHVQKKEEMHCQLLLERALLDFKGKKDTNYLGVLK